MSAVTQDLELEELRYPIGRFRFTADVGAAAIDNWINSIESLPSELAKAVKDLTDAQLDTPYRPGGWTVRQLVHHVADSHINSYVRFRWALTEESPAIKVYDEKAWAQLSDAASAPVEISLQLLTALHARWVLLLRSLSIEDWSRTFQHPQTGEFPLLRALGLYAWHSRHHLAHVTNLRSRQGW
jgi:uncharacterized damage-inducible protein DinB